MNDHPVTCSCNSCRDTTFVRISERDWQTLQMTLAELKSRVHDLELRLNSVDSSLQLLIVDAGY
jgi:hypothetical protein